MIYLSRDTNYSMNINFDIDGANELFKALNNSINGKNNIVSLDRDFKYDYEKVKFICFSINNTRNEFKINNQIINMYIDEDELEFAMIRFEKCMNSKDYFNPAEFCEILYKNYQLYLYCLLI